MKLVECPSCKAVNRLQSFAVARQATCGRCHAPLPEPAWIRVVRAGRYNAGWAVLGALVLVGVLQPFSGSRTPPSLDPPTRSAPGPASVSTQRPPWELPWTNGETSSGATKPPQPQRQPDPVPVGVPIRQAQVLLNARPNGTGAPFSLTTSTGTGGFYFKLVDVQTGQTAFAGLVPAGGRYEFEVPVGTYRLRYATGPGWVDEYRHFGSDTLYSEGGSTLNFYEDARGVYGHDVQLILRRDGNFSTHRISAANF